MSAAVVRGDGRRVRKVDGVRMLWTRGKWHTHDTYMQPVRTVRRHALCACEVPCQARFVCEACRRSKPWCVGGSDDERCDACWVKRGAP